MSRTLKWVLGILAVLVLIAVVAGGVWVLQNRFQMMASVRPYTAQPNAPGTPNAPNGQNPPFGPRAFGGNRRNPMGGWGFRGPMMGGRFFGRGMPFGMGFFFLGGLLRLIIPLGLLALVAILFYQLGKRAALPRAAAPVAREPVPSEAPKSDQDLPKTS
jgi:predicted lipid-binding transport protein (Tim44 family)